MNRPDIMDMDALQMAAEIAEDRAEIERLKEQLHAMSMRARKAEKRADHWMEYYRDAARKAWSK